MASAGKVLAGLGAVVLAAMAAGIWLVMSDEQPGDTGGTAAAAVAGTGTTGDAPETGPRKPTRKHAQATGSSSVIGSVRRRQDSSPAAGQVVTLTREGMEPWTAQADAAGSFRIGELADGGPYEVSVAAKGCGTIRLPGLTLTRGEAFDVGTLWLDLAVKVTVSVRTWGDVAVDGADVEAYAAPETRWGFDWSRQQALLTTVPVAVATVKTGTDGKAVFPELASGLWTFAAHKDGLARDGRSSVRFEGGAEPPEVRIFLATGHKLRGRVLDGDRRPIADASIIAGRPTAWNDQGVAPLRVRTKSDEQGMYEMTGLPPGDIALQVGLPRGVPYQAAMVRIPAVAKYDLIVKSGGSLSGTVTESGTGKPVEGVLVRATGQRNSEATTDALGKYLIAAVADGPVNDVQVSKEGWLQDRGEDLPMKAALQLNPGDTATRDFRMKRGAKVTGVVSGAQGPISGARVQVWVQSVMNRTPMSKSVFTDAAGRYEVAPVDAGKGMVHVLKDGWIQKGLPDNWQQAAQQGNVPPQYRVEVPEQGEAKLDVVLDAGSRIEGKVEADGTPVAGATVTLYSSQGRPPATATTDASGSFVLTGATPGPKVSLFPAKDGLVAGRNEPVQVLLDQPTTGVVLKMVRQRMIRGKAASSAGAPLRDGQVVVVLKQPGAPQGGGGVQYVNYEQTYAYSGGQAATAPIREDGSFEIGIPYAEGSVAVRATALDHAPGESTPVQMVDTQTQYEANVLLESGYAIRGRVASKGVGLAGADITVAPGRNAGTGGGASRVMPQAYYSGMNQGAGTIVAVSDADGAFTVLNLSTGSYAVSASAEGYQRNSVPEVKVPAAGDVTLDLEPSLEITGRVQFADGAPAPGAIVVAQKDDPNNKEQQFGYQYGGQQSVTGADGSFRIRGLSSGGFRLTAQAPWDGSVNFKNLTTEPVTSGTTGYKLLVQQGGRISGKVLDPQKKPVQGSWIYANPSTPSEHGAYEWHYGFSRKDGTFEVSGLSDGPHTLTVNPPQSGEQSALRMTKADNVAVGRADLELMLEAGLTIEGTVVDAQSKPLSEAWLRVQWKPDPQNPNQQPNINGNRMMSYADAEGRFRFDGLAPGKYSVHLQAQPGSRWDGLLLTGNDDIAAGASGVTLVATTGEKIAGVVVDESGTGLAGATIYAMTGGANRNATTDKDGKFEITGLPRGSVRVQASARGRPPVMVDKVETGSLVVRIVVGKGGVIAGRVLDGSGNAYANQNVYLKAAQGGQTSWVQTGADGRFTSQPLAEGTWEIMALKTGKEGQQEWVKVGTAHTGETVDVSLP